MKYKLLPHSNRSYEMLLQKIEEHICSIQKDQGVYAPEIHDAKFYPIFLLLKIIPVNYITHLDREIKAFHDIIDLCKQKNQLSLQNNLYISIITHTMEALLQKVRVELKDKNKEDTLSTEQIRQVKQVLVYLFKSTDKLKQLDTPHRVDLHKFHKTAYAIYIHHLMVPNDGNTFSLQEEFLIERLIPIIEEELVFFDQEENKIALELILDSVESAFNFIRHLPNPKHIKNKNINKNIKTIQKKVCQLYIECIDASDYDVIINCVNSFVNTTKLPQLNHKKLHLYELMLDLLNPLVTITPYSSIAQSLKVDILVSYSKLLQTFPSYQKSKKYVKKLMLIAQQAADQVAMLPVYFNIGLYFQHYNKHKQALTAYHLITKHELTEKYDLERAKIYLNIAMMLKATDNDKAYNYAQQALALLEKLNDVKYDKQISIAYNALGNIHASKGELHQALHYYRKNLVVKKRSQSVDSKCIVLLNIAMILTAFGHHAEATDNLEKILGFYMHGQITDIEIIAKVLCYLGAIALNECNYTLATDYYFKSCEIRRKFDNRRGLMMSYLYLSECYSKQGKVKWARIYWNRAVKYYHGNRKSSGWKILENAQKEIIKELMQISIQEEDYKKTDFYDKIIKEHF